MSELMSPHQDLESAPTHYVYIAGLLGSDRGQDQTRKFFDENFSDKTDSVSVYSSMISEDKPDPNKISRLVDDLYTRLVENGEHVKCVVHSFGAAELNIIIRKLRSKSSVTPELLSQQLEIVLVSPFGFATKFKEKVEMLKRVVEKSSALHFGVASLTFLPPANFSNQELANCLNSALPGGINDQLLSTIKHYSTEGEGFFDNFSDNDQSRAIEIASDFDEKLKHSAQEEDWETFNNVLVDRGKALKTFINKAFAGKTKKNENDSQEKNYLLQNILSFIKSSEGRKILKSTLTGEVYRTFLYLKAEGVKIQFLVPQLDVILPFDEVLDIFQDTAPEPQFRQDRTQEQAEVLGVSGHESFAVRSQGFANLIKKMFTGGAD